MRQVILAIFVLTCSSCFGFAQSAEGQTVLTGEQVVAIVSPSVVLVLVGEGGERATRQGSGVIVRPEGLLLTAYHLVKGARQVQVKLQSGELFDKVDLIGYDDRRDVAALRISARGLRPVSAAKVDDAKPGEAIYVVSNPEGLGWTASSGVLSATRLADEVPGAGKGYRLIQFSAPVSPGSSGGAMVDAEGRCLGIVTGSLTGQNLNFAVPNESVLGLADGTGGTSYAVAGELQPRKPEATPPQATPSPGATSVPKGDFASIMRTVRSFYVEAKEEGLGIPAEPLTKKLLEEPEFRSGELLVTQQRASADLVIELSRKSATWDFTYQLVHPASGLILGSGKVIAWDGVRAAPGLSKQIMMRIRELRKDAGLVPAEPKKKK